MIFNVHRYFETIYYIYDNGNESTQIKNIKVFFQVIFKCFFKCFSSIIINS